MERTQISLTSEQAGRLRRLAERRGTSMAGLIREAVDRVFPTDDATDLDARWARALAAVGSASGTAQDVSRNHDAYLADAFADDTEGE